MSTRSTDDLVKERIREASDILDVVEQCVPLRKAGSNFKACCPFHEEKTPSFNVHPAKQIWHCFGCGAGGDVFAFVMQYHGMSFPEALRHLANRAGISLPEQRARSADEVGRDEVLAVNARYAVWSQDMLLRRSEGEPARAYLQDRGIHADVAKAFGFGFAPDAWDAGCTALAEADPRHLLAAGLARPRQDGSLYDLFRNRITIPIRGVGGDIVAFGGRTIGDDPAKYINSPETVVYHKGAQLYRLYEARRALQEAGRAILVEGYFDAVLLAEAGFPETVATCGTALTPQQAKVLARYTGRVALAYDGDSAGCAAAEKAAAQLLAAGMDVDFVSVPDGADPDEYLRAQGPEAMAALLHNTRDFVDFVLQDAPGGNALTIEERVRYVDRLTALAAHIPHPTRRSLFQKKIAVRLAVDPATLPQVRADPPPAETEPAPPAPVRLRESEREILRLVLGNLDALRDLEHVEPACADMAPPVQAIVRRAVEAQPPYVSVPALVADTESEAERQIMRELELEPQERRRYAPEWWHHHIQRRLATQAASALRDQLAGAEAAGDDELVRQLLGDLRSVATRKQESTAAALSMEVEHSTL